jgi:hypothetical protein
VPRVLVVLHDGAAGGEGDRGDHLQGEELREGKKNGINKTKKVRGE